MAAIVGVALERTNIGQPDSALGVERSPVVKILYLVPQPKRSDRIGAYTFLDEEIQALAAAGVEAYALSTAASADGTLGKVHLRAYDPRVAGTGQARSVAFLAARTGSWPAANLLSPRACFRTARIEYAAAMVAQEVGADLIHSHLAWPQGSGGMMARTAVGIPLVASLRGTDILLDEGIEYGRRGDPLFDRSLRGLLRNADRTVYFSRWMRDKGVALGAVPERTRVIRKGVDLSQFTVASDREALREELGLGRRPMLLTVAGLIQRKGIHYILEGLAQLRGELDFTFVVCGEGPERQRLETLSRTLGIADRTRFMGQVDRQTIPKYFAACDVFLLASVLEAAGNVLFEAMAAGRPVICTDSGGPPEYVRDGETGFVVPVGSADALADRVRSLLEDPQLRERLGAEARRRTLGEFDYDRMVADLMGVYEETLSQAPRKHANAQ